MIRFKEHPTPIVDMTGPCADRHVLYSWTASLSPIVDYDADVIMSKISGAETLDEAIKMFNHYFGNVTVIDRGPKVIDLSGPSGNAMTLINYYGVPYARCMGLDSKEIKGELLKVLDEGGYENFLRKFDEYFGDYLILER